MIGIFSDSHGDLDAFDRAYQLLKQKGARRFFFAGGRYSDLDEWISSRKQQERGGRSYSDQDFLSDVSSWLSSGPQVERGPVFGAGGGEDAAPAGEDWNRVREKFVRTPERDCLQYRDPNVQKKAVDMLGDTLCCIVHDKNDLDREDLLNATVFIHGKEPAPGVKQIGPRYFVTAGQLTGAVEQTCGLIEQVDKALRFSAFTLDGRQVLEPTPLTQIVAGKTKLSVK